MSYSVTIYYNDSTIASTSFLSDVGVSVTRAYGADTYSASGFSGGARFTATAASGCTFSHWVYRVGSLTATQQTSYSNPFTYTSGQDIYIRAVGTSSTTTTYNLTFYIYTDGNLYSQYTSTVGSNFQLGSVVSIPTGYTFSYAMIGGQQITSLTEYVTVTSSVTYVTVYCVSGGSSTSSYTVTNKGTWSTSVSQQSVAINAYQVLRYSYTPAYDGTIQWYSSTSTDDTIGWIGASTSVTIDSKGYPSTCYGSYYDDYSNSSAFYATATVTAGVTYYLYVCIYNGGASSSNTLKLIFNKTVTSNGAVHLWTGSSWSSATMYIYNGTTWVPAAPYLMYGTAWTGTI